jgi:hypothetical protein
VYVAGKYTASTEEEMERNIRAAVGAARTLWDMGHVPFVPHLTHYMKDIMPLGRKDWLVMDFVWLRQCDAVVVISLSDGAAKEAVAAATLGIPVYWGLEDMPVDRDAQMVLHDQYDEAIRGNS